MQTLVSFQGRKQQGLGGEQDKNGLLGWLRNTSVLFFWCMMCCWGQIYIFTLLICWEATWPVLCGVCFWSILVMQAVWIFKAASPHPCDRSKRDSWTLKFLGKRSEIVLLYSEGELWQQNLRAEYMHWQVEQLGWALRGRQLLWPSSVCQSISSGQEMRSFAAKMDTVEEIINNVNSCIFSTLSHKWSITFWVPDTSFYGNKLGQKDTGNNGNRSHLFASVTLLFLLVLDDVCVTSSICFWFLGPGFLCLCGTVLLLFNIHVASSAPCSVLTFRC